MRLLFAAMAIAVCAMAQPINTGGGAAIACIGTPGSTVASVRVQCLDSAKNLWVCTNAAGCSVAADWAAVGTPPAYTTVTFVAGGMTFATTSATVQGFTYTLTANMTGASTFSPALTNGQIVYLRPCENGTGGFTNSYPALVSNAGSVDLTASACTAQGFQFDGANLNPIGPAVSTNAIPGALFSTDTGLWREAAGILDLGTATANDKTGTLKLGTIVPSLYQSATNCSSSGGTCVAAPAGSVSIAAAATTVTVATTAVTANSQILLTEDATLGTKLSVTCNTTTGRLYTVTTRTAGTSFVITASAAPAANPACLSYLVVN